MIGLSVPEVIPCSVTDQGMTITWTTIEDVSASSAFQVEAFEAFNNPISTEETSTF